MLRLYPFLPLPQPFDMTLAVGWPNERVRPYVMGQEGVRASTSAIRSIVRASAATTCL